MKMTFKEFVEKFKEFLRELYNEFRAAFLLEDKDACDMTFDEFCGELFVEVDESFLSIPE